MSLFCFEQCCPAMLSTFGLMKLFSLLEMKPLAAGESVHKRARSCMLPGDLNWVSILKPTRFHLRDHHASRSCFLVHRAVAAFRRCLLPMSLAFHGGGRRPFCIHLCTWAFLGAARVSRTVPENPLSLKPLMCGSRFPLLFGVQREEIMLMAEADASAKGIVFSQFTSFLDLIKYSLEMVTPPATPHPVCLFIFIYLVFHSFLHSFIQ